MSVKPPKADRLTAGTLVTNGHGAVFEITDRDEYADIEGLEYSGYFARVIDGGKTGGEGKRVYLDDRDFRDGGLAVLPASELEG